jgi:hypothetical protein
VQTYLAGQNSAMAVEPSTLRTVKKYTCQQLSPITKAPINSELRFTYNTDGTITEENK